jgi:type I restriction enzyme R subunit
MSGSNFTFLVVHRPVLAELGKQAEQYVNSDPQSAVVKLRCFAEFFVGIIYQELSLSSVGLTNLYEKLEHPAFVDVVEDCVVKKLHAVRMKGNKAAHMDGVSVSEALWLVKEAFFLGAWLNVAQDSGVIGDLPKYQAPQPAIVQQETILREKEYLEKDLFLQTVELCM